MNRMPLINQITYQMGERKKSVHCAKFSFSFILAQLAFVCAVVVVVIVVFIVAVVVFSFDWHCLLLLIFYHCSFSISFTFSILRWPSLHDSVANKVPCRKTYNVANALEKNVIHVIWVKIRKVFASPSFRRVCIWRFFFLSFVRMNLHNVAKPTQC